MNNLNYNEKLFDIKNFNKWLITFVPISIIFGNLFFKINIILVDILFIYFFFKRNIKLEKYLCYILIFLTIIFTIKLINTFDSSLTSKAILGIIRYLIFFLAFTYFLGNEQNKNFFLKITFYVIVFVLIDVLIQYLFGKDIFGNEYSVAHGKRLSGPFGDEYVVGAYLSKLYFLGLMFLFLKLRIILLISATY